MTAVGHNDILWTNLSVLATGVARDFADKAAMVTAGYDLTWYDDAGDALASQPTWTMERSETNGDHMLAYAVPLGAYGIRLTVPGTDYASVALWSGIGYTYGPDDLGSLIATSGGVALTPVTTSDEAEIYDGDSIILDFSVTEAALTYINAASLTACDTLLAQIKLNTNDSDETADVTGFTNTVTSDTSGNRVLRAVLAAFPAALAVPDGAKSIACTAQLRATEGTKTAIVSEIALTVKWKATTA
jgi:hypothetical protein